MRQIKISHYNLILHFSKAFCVDCVLRACTRTSPVRPARPRLYFPAISPPHATPRAPDTNTLCSDSSVASRLEAAPGQPYQVRSGVLPRSVSFLAPPILVREPWPCAGADSLVTYERRMRMMASASRAICCVQRLVSNGRRSSEAAPARRLVAAPMTRHSKASVIRSELGSSRGQHCAPANAIADSAPITATKVHL
jgi:hypothetical protein